MLERLFRRKSAKNIISRGIYPPTIDYIRGIAKNHKIALSDNQIVSCEVGVTEHRIIRSIDYNTSRRTYRENTLTVVIDGSSDQNMAFQNILAQYYSGIAQVKICSDGRRIPASKTEKTGNPAPDGENHLRPIAAE